MQGDEARARLAAMEIVIGDLLGRVMAASADAEAEAEGLRRRAGEQNRPSLTTAPEPLVRAQLEALIDLARAMHRV